MATPVVPVRELNRTPWYRLCVTSRFDHGFGAVRKRCTGGRRPGKAHSSVSSVVMVRPGKTPYGSKKTHLVPTGNKGLSVILAKKGKKSGAWPIPMRERRRGWRCFRTQRGAGVGQEPLCEPWSRSQQAVEPGFSAPGQRGPLAYRDRLLSGENIGNTAPSGATRACRCWSG